MFAGGGEGEEAGLPVGMPPAVLALLPLCCLRDRFLGVEATATLKSLASRLATKWRQPYSKTCGYVNSKIVITLVRATHCAYGDLG